MADRSKQWCVERWNPDAEAWVVLLADLTENQATGVWLKFKRDTDVKYRIRKLEGYAYRKEETNALPDSLPDAPLPPRTA